MDISSLIISVGAEFFQYYEMITSEQYLGVATGSNLDATSYFYSTIKLTGSDPNSLLSVFRDLGGALTELTGCLANRSPFDTVDRLNGIFLNYSGCSGITNSMFMTKMGR